MYLNKLSTKCQRTKKIRMGNMLYPLMHWVRPWSHCLKACLPIDWLHAGSAAERVSKPSVSSSICSRYNPIRWIRLHAIQIASNGYLGWLSHTALKRKTPQITVFVTFRKVLHRKHHTVYFTFSLILAFWDVMVSLLFVVAVFPL